MQVANLQPHIAQIISEIFRGSFGQRRYENTLALFHALATKLDCLVDLVLKRLHRDFRIEQSGRPNDLFDDKWRTRRVRIKLLRWLIRWRDMHL
jgi:hypothetical protein